MLDSRPEGLSQEERRAARRLLLMISLPVLGVGAVLWFLPPHEYRIYPPCPWFALTDSYCPGCGSGRGLSAVLRGDALGLLRNNLMAGLCAPFLAYAYLRLLVRGALAYELPRLRLPDWGAYSLVVLIIAFGVARNFVPALAPCSLG